MLKLIWILRVKVRNTTAAIPEVPAFSYFALSACSSVVAQVNALSGFGAFDFIGVSTGNSFQAPDATDQPDR
ncbi:MULTISPECIES: hypothetical protein [Microbulbifer]|uniref:hypothetical protein n=1 Tax=Microbulbifer TaxID=48073 RepID=UPI001144FB74|nr:MULTISPECIES: hypothetical protein [Microbulbifer]